MNKSLIIVSLPCWIINFMFGPISPWYICYINNWMIMQWVSNKRKDFLGCIFTVQTMLSYNYVTWPSHKRICVVTIKCQFDLTVYFSLTFHLKFLRNDDSCYWLLSLCETEVNTFNRHINIGNSFVRSLTKHTT